MKKLLLSLLTLVVGLGASAQSNVTIEFVKSTDKDGTAITTTLTVDKAVTENSVKYVEGKFTQQDKAYYNSVKGLKFGTASGTGSATFALSDEGQINATGIIVNAASYTSADLNTSVKITINGTDEYETNQFSNADLDDYKVTFSQPTVIKTIKLESNGTVNKKKRTYIGAITLLDASAVDPSKTKAILKWSPESQTINLGDEFAAPEFSKSAKDVVVEYATDNDAVLDVNKTTGEFSYKGVAGTAKITASVSSADPKYYGDAATYTLTVVDPNAPVSCYTSALGDDFTFDNPTGLEVWKHDSQYGLKGTAYINSKTNATVAIAASPVLDLTNYKDITLDFEEAFNNYKENGTTINIGDFSGYAYVVVKEAGDSEWVEVCEATHPTEFDRTFFANDHVDLSAYSNKKVQVGFKYVSTAEVAGTWEVKNIKVSGVVGQAPVVPTDVRPVFTVAADDWQDEATYTVYKGAKVTISAPEEAEEGWILSYTVNGGGEQTALETVELTISENTTISAYINDKENGVVSKTYNVAKLPDVVLDPVFGAVEDGTEVTVTCTVEDATLSGSVGDDVFKGETLPYTFTVTDDVEVGFCVEHPKYISSEGINGTYTIKLPELRPRWEAVTRMEQVKDGDIVTFMAKEYTGKASGTNVTYPEVVMSDVNSDVITCVEFVYENYQLPVETAKFTLNKVSDGVVTLYSEDANKGEGGYLSATARNKVRFVSDPKELTLSFNNDGAAIVGGVTISQTDYTLRYNANVAKQVDVSTARFAFYASGQQDIYMYRMIDSGLDIPEHNIPEGQVIVEGHNMLITCAKGAHIWTRESEYETKDNGANKVVAKEDGWTNHEANRVEYEIKELGKKIEMKAVSTDGKVHSNVITLEVDPSGNTTSIRAISVAEEEGVEAQWYDLQGRRVAEPAKGGVFILKQGSKVSKQVF